MSAPALAPSSNSAGRQYTPEQNPFASPNASPIQHPEPCAQPVRTPRSTQVAAANGHTSTRQDRLSEQSEEYETSKSYSLSSAGDGSHMSPVSSIDLEKRRAPPEQAPKRPARPARDPEKAMEGSRKSQQRRANMGDSISMTYCDDDEDDDGGRQLQERKAVKILLHLAGPCVILSFLNAAWTLISLILTVFTQPVRLCARRPSFGQQLGGLLGPALNLQLKSIYTPLAPHANEDMSYYSTTLVTVHLLSPFTSFVLMFFSWVLAFYWMISAILGDPAGMDKRDDGRESVLALRRWWEYWLMRCVKDE